MLDAHALAWDDTAPPPITKDPEFEELVRLYRDLPESQRERLLSIVRATAAALGASREAAAERRATARRELTDAR